MFDSHMTLPPTGKNTTRPIFTAISQMKKRFKVSGVLVQAGMYDFSNSQLPQLSQPHYQISLMIIFTCFFHPVVMAWVRV